MEITFWGVRGSTPTANEEYMQYGGNTTCVQIDWEGQEDILILDSGTGIRNLGNYLVENGKSVNGHLFVTHPHWDHLQGFPFFKPIYDYDTFLKVHLPQQPGGSCKDILAGQMKETYFPVTPEMLHADIQYITQPKTIKDYENFRVEFMLANHHTNTAVYKFYVENKQVIFAPDNEIVPMEEGKDDEFNNAFRNFIAGADILIHDAQYSLEVYKDKREWGHSAWEEVIKWAREADVSHLVLTHHDPDSVDEMLAERQQTIKNEYENDFDSIQLAYEQLVMNV